jgi:hypothetical protein
MIIKCITCKKDFIGREGRVACSLKCRPTKKKNRIKAKCFVCNKGFEYWAGRPVAKYCSKKCWNIRKPKVLTDCMCCGKEFWSYKSDNKSYCSKKCYSLNLREIKKGEKSPFWKGGITKLNKLERARGEYREWRNDVFARDNYTCQKCGIKSGKGLVVYLHAHHIKEFALHPELRFSVSNGITLCKNCHLLEHFHKF